MIINKIGTSLFCVPVTSAPLDAEAFYGGITSSGYLEYLTGSLFLENTEWSAMMRNKLQTLKI